MKTGKWMNHRRIGALLAALLLALCVSAQADTEDDLVLVMAQDAVETLDLRNAENEPLVPRMAPESAGRGIPDTAGEEPDYRGVVGYVALQAVWEVSRFNTFTQTPWMLPMYEPDGDGWKIVGAVQHKTLVLVLDQAIREELGHKYAGKLKVVRLDINKETWIDVTNFVTVPYWMMDLPQAVQYGYCIAVYRNRSRYEPIDRKNHSGTLPEGTRILMCEKRTSRYFSPDKAHNPLLGIVFRSKKESESYLRTFLFFNADDLTLVY